MPRIKINERHAVFSAIAEILECMPHPVPMVNADDYRLLVWTPEELETVKKAIELGKFYKNRIEEICHETRIPFEHETLPAKVTIEVRCRIAERGDNTFCVFPKNTEFREDHNINIVQKIDNDIGELATVMYERGLFKEYVWRLVENCTKHEQVRYLLPFYVSILRRADLDDAASQVEAVKSAPPLPYLTIEDRTVLKFLNKWWAVQELLGNFGLSKQKPILSTSDDLCFDLKFMRIVNPDDGNIIRRLPCA